MIVKPTIFQRPSHLNSFFLSAILIYRPQSLFQKLTNRRVTATAKIFSCPAFPLFHKQLSFCQNRQKRSTFWEQSAIWMLWWGPQERAMQVKSSFIWTLYSPTEPNIATVSNSKMYLSQITKCNCPNCKLYFPTIVQQNQYNRREGWCSLNI